MFLVGLLTAAIMLSDVSGTPAQPIAVIAERTQEEEIIALTYEIGEAYGISPFLLQSVIWHESGFRPEVGNGECFGLMGISARWNRDRMERLGVTDLHDPRSNILVGADLLAELEDTLTEGETASLELVLMAYNAGAGPAKEAWEKGLVSDYARRVIERMEEIEHAAAE